MSWVQVVAALMVDNGASALVGAFLGIVAVWVAPALLVIMALAGLEAWAVRLRREGGSPACSEGQQPAQRRR